MNVFYFDLQMVKKNLKASLSQNEELDWIKTFKSHPKLLSEPRRASGIKFVLLLEVVLSFSVLMDL